MARSGLEHLAEDHGIDVADVDSRSLDGCAQRGGSELDRGEGGDGSVEFAERCPGPCKDDDFALTHGYS